MTPGARRGRILSGSDESHLRDLSPSDTLRAFAERPMPFDTSRDEYKILACIENLTPTERDLGARVAKAASRLKSWCQEIEQWGWSGSFESPSEERQEEQRNHIRERVREHVRGPAADDAVARLEYWGSLLSVEVEAHEARLDEIADELHLLDIDELKEYVQDIHGPNRSRPSSSYSTMSRSANYIPLDDFSFLITQTLISALPHHFQLRRHLSTWRARVTILREAPRYINDLQIAQNAMKLGWDALEPPTDSSDTASEKWKVAIDTISDVLRDKVGDLGKRLDRMLDTAEVLDDSLPDEWIDIFEGIEADYGRWVTESRSRIIAFDIQRKSGAHIRNDGHSTIAPTLHSSDEMLEIPRQRSSVSEDVAYKLGDGANDTQGRTRSDTTFKVIESDTQEGEQQTPTSHKLPSVAEQDPAKHEQPSSLNREVTPEPEIFQEEESIFEEGDTVVHHELDDTEDEEDGFDHSEIYQTEQGGSFIHHELEDMEEEDEQDEDVQETSHLDLNDTENGFTSSFESNLEHDASPSPTLHASPVTRVVVTIGGENTPSLIRPQTPRSRRNSTDTLSSTHSISSSPPTLPEDSPSLRKEANPRHAKPPRPSLNAAITKKRRPLEIIQDSAIEDPVPWPPTQFSKQLSPAETLDRQISDILTTIPAKIRLTSDPKHSSNNNNKTDPKSSKPRLASKGSARYLRPTRSTTSLKSPEPTLMLSPAKPGGFDAANPTSGSVPGRRSAAASRSDTHNDIKLYHLTQPGRPDHPIKLFIRRVGENGERVMVRVGGGWADLGEYLRQYAEHHGRRTISEGKFEILGLEVPESPRAESAMGGAGVRRFSGGSVREGEGSRSAGTTPRKRREGGGGVVGIGVSREESAPAPAMGSLSGTPKQETSATTTTTPGSNESHRSWTGTEVGLAGPNAKKLDLSEQKREWIEGMMKQARTVSGSLPPASISASTGHRSVTPGSHHRGEGSGAGSRAEARDTASGSYVRKSGTEFGDLGRVGKTKRVFLRGNTLSERER